MALSAVLAFVFATILCLFTTQFFDRFQADDTENESSASEPPENPALDDNTPVNPRPRRGYPGRPRVLQSSEEDLSQEENVEFSDQDSSLEDFDTESDEEDASDHEAEVVSWPRPAQFPAQLRKNPELAKFDVPWTVSATRDGIPHLHADLPDQDETFTIEPDGDVPFALMFLNALPLQAFWQLIVCAETGRYAEENEATPGRADGRRSWDNARMNTVANWLRVVACIIMRGLVPSTSDRAFFADETYNCGDNRYDRPGASKVCGLDLNTYEQLIRFFHLVDSSVRAANEAADHDKAWLVRPFLTFLNNAFARWCVCGRNNAVDEAGLPSRHSWLRTRNVAKPHRYFIEILMGCCSGSRFCWHLILNEGKYKIVERANRARGQSKYMQVTHYQHEFNADERSCQDTIGVAAAQMLYFARVLRERDNDPDQRMCYRIFTDRRWCSLPAMYSAKKLHNVSYTCSVVVKSRFHVCYQLGVTQSKKRHMRGKYRSALLQVDDDVRVTTVCWSDSNLCGYASCDLGTEGETFCMRRSGRWKRRVPYPIMVKVRGDHFRAVDQSDQLRLGKCHFDYICRKKAWPKVFWGGIELVLVNIYCIARGGVRFRNILQREFRWATLLQLVVIADRIDARARMNNPRHPRGADYTQDDRYHGVSTHHHATWPEYVDEFQLDAMEKRMTDFPGNHKGAQRARVRDEHRGGRTAGRTTKVRNPAWYESTCIVCWAFGKKKRTAMYCKECSLDPVWSFKCRIGGWANECQPHICSKECWVKFHTQRIPGLDFNQRTSVRPRPRGRRARTTPAQTRRARRRLAVDSPASEPDFEGVLDPQPGPAPTAAPASAVSTTPPAAATNSAAAASTNSSAAAVPSNIMYAPARRSSRLREANSRYNI